MCVCAADHRQAARPQQQNGRQQPTKIKTTSCVARRQLRMCAPAERRALRFLFATQQNTRKKTHTQTQTTGQSRVEFKGAFDQIRYAREKRQHTRNCVRVRMCIFRAFCFGCVVLLVFRAAKRTSANAPIDVRT